MNPAAKALWYIEAHFAQAPSLDDVASFAGVSRFHLSRMFTVLTGSSVMRYARARRLTEAARTLAAGAPDMHEAFTRAFRDPFGLTPEALRARGRVNGMEIIIRLDRGSALRDFRHAALRA